MVVVGARLAGLTAAPRRSRETIRDGLTKKSELRGPQPALWRTAFRGTPSLRTIALIGISSALGCLRISARSSTVITLHR